MFGEKSGTEFRRGAGGHAPCRVQGGALAGTGGAAPLTAKVQKRGSPAEGYAGVG